MKSELIEELCQGRGLSVSSYAELISSCTERIAAELADIAVRECSRVYGNAIYTRGLIEFTNHCKNDCFYCGLRAGNVECRRYRLSRRTIVKCADRGYDSGIRTFVLQGGEDPALTDKTLCNIVYDLKWTHPDCAVTVSVGERSRESYRELRAAGADRYLLRHETARPEHYRRLHPRSMSYDVRMRCLSDLRELGFVVGAGFMVGSPYQTPRELATDLKFIEEFKPDMCGIGPFVPHHATPFARFAGGTAELTCFILSMIRIICPSILLPATTALESIEADGYERGILSGANVVMPNLTPENVRDNYEIYDGKTSMDGGSAESLRMLGERMLAIGKRVVVDRGDPLSEVA